MEVEKGGGMEFGFFTSRLDKMVGWARKYSLFQYPFVTACCGMEYMSVACAHYDIERFGAGLPRFSPRQADVLFVVGTISQKIAPILQNVYEQMCCWLSVSALVQAAFMMITRRSEASIMSFRSTFISPAVRRGRKRF